MDLDYIKSRIHEIMLKRIAMGAGEGMYGESMHGYGDGYGEGYRRKRVTRKRKHHDEMHILPIVVKAGMRHSKGAGEGYRKRRATRRRHSDEVRRYRQLIWEWEKVIDEREQQKEDIQEELV